MREDEKLGASIARSSVASGSCRAGMRRRSSAATLELRPVEASLLAVDSRRGSRRRWCPSSLWDGVALAESIRVTAFSALSKPISGFETSLRTIRSALLRVELLAGAVDVVAPCSAAKATTVWPSARVAARLARMSSVGSRWRSRAPSRVSLPAATSLARKSAGAAAIRRTWALGNSALGGLGELRRRSRRRCGGRRRARAGRRWRRSGSRRPRGGRRRRRGRCPCGRWSGCRGSGPGRSARGCRRR